MSRRARCRRSSRSPGRTRVRQVMRDVLKADRKPDGQLRQDNVFRYVLAAKE